VHHNTETCLQNFQKFPDVVPPYILVSFLPLFSARRRSMRGTASTHSSTIRDPHAIYYPRFENLGLEPAVNSIKMYASEMHIQKTILCYRSSAAEVKFYRFLRLLQPLFSTLPEIFTRLSLVRSILKQPFNKFYLQVQINSQFIKSLSH
jgi:hypothetical protein